VIEVPLGVFVCAVPRAPRDATHRCPSRLGGPVYRRFESACSAAASCRSTASARQEEPRCRLVRPLVVGDSAAVLLDGRYGSFGIGSNGALAARWVILDTHVADPELAP
jgi:hypothetical protein